MIKLLLVVNDAAFFLSHRLPIAKAAVAAGYEVHVALGGVEDVHRRQIFESGLTLHELPLSRSGRNLFSEIILFISILTLFRTVKPDVLHLVTIKPVIYGGIAARLTRIRRVVAAISGLGFVFVARGTLNKAFRGLITLSYRLALRRRKTVVIFQNPDDRDAMVHLGAISREQARLIRGSGVDLDAYPYCPEPESVPVVCFAARLLKDKGICEFVEAARILKSRGVRAHFKAIGDIDHNNPASITEEQLCKWKSEGVVEFPGFLRDIASQYIQSHVVCLPSYREGLPKSLLEAAACGRPVVTTDVPGCRDAIEVNRSGWLVPVRDSLTLADTLESLLLNREKRREMGDFGRRLAEREFSIEKVVDTHMRIYSELLS